MMIGLVQLWYSNTTVSKHKFPLLRHKNKIVFLNEKKKHFIFSLKLTNNTMQNKIGARKKGFIGLHN